MEVLKLIGVVLGFWIGSLGSFIFAFITGLQKNGFFAAISFLAFFMLGVILFQQGIYRIKEYFKEKKAQH